MMMGKIKREFTDKLVPSLLICALSCLPMWLFAKDLTDGSEAKATIAAALFTFLGVMAKQIVDIWRDEQRGD